jgi:hypothetical protein
MYSTKKEVKMEKQLKIFISASAMTFNSTIARPKAQSGRLVRKFHLQRTSGHLELMQLNGFLHKIPTKDRK